MRNSRLKTFHPLIAMAFAALVTAPISAGAAGPPDGQNVNIINDTSSPVPVISAGPPANGEPFQTLLADAVAFDVGGNTTGSLFFDLVPAGKRAVIEFVSLTSSFSQIPPDERSAFLSLLTQEAGAPLGSAARVGIPFHGAGGRLGGTQAILLYLEHGQSLEVAITRSNNSSAETFSVQLTGRLIDVE